MSPSSSTKRYRINPIEIAIFSAIALVFTHSVYNLFYNRTEFGTTLTPMSSNPVSEGRNLASNKKTLMTVTANCEPTQSEIAQVNKVRLNGHLCGLNRAGEDVTLKSYSVVNTNGNFHATVFANDLEGRYSTDYIPISSGENKLHVEFAYSNGNKFSQELTISH